MQLITRGSHDFPGYIGGPFASIQVNPNPQMTPIELTEGLRQLFGEGPVPVYSTAVAGGVLIVMPDPCYVQWRLQQAHGDFSSLAELVLSRR